MSVNFFRRGQGGSFIKAAHSPGSSTHGVTGKFIYAGLLVATAIGGFAILARDIFKKEVLHIDVGPGAVTATGKDIAHESIMGEVLSHDTAGHAVGEAVHQGWLLPALEHLLEAALHIF